MTKSFRKAGDFLWNGALYSLSLPERYLRGLTALIGGMLRETTELVLPKFVKDLVDIKDELKAGGKILLWALGLYAGFKLLMLILTPFIWGYTWALKAKNFAEKGSIKMQKKLATTKLVYKKVKYNQEV